ncbi:M6 family metalloprotease domain-containing protein, partial [Streptomyces xantholiticus]
CGVGGGGGVGWVWSPTSLRGGAFRTPHPPPAPPAPVRGGSIGTRLAVVRTGPESALAIEARGATGNDAYTCTEGVLLYRVRAETASGGGPVEVVDTHPETGACWGESVYPQLADAPLRVGETFTAPGPPGGRARVEVAERTQTGSWTVKITTA